MREPLFESQERPLQQVVGHGRRRNGGGQRQSDPDHSFHRVVRVADVEEHHERQMKDVSNP